MNKIKELEMLAKDCLHCQGRPKAYHQNFVGDTFVGDEYMFECGCGIETMWFEEKKLLQVWNARPIE